MCHSSIKRITFDTLLHVVGGLEPLPPKNEGGGATPFVSFGSVLEGKCPSGPYEPPIDPGPEASDPEEIAWGRNFFEPYSGKETPGESSSPDAIRGWADEIASRLDKESGAAWLSFVGTLDPSDIQALEEPGDVAEPTRHLPCGLDPVWRLGDEKWCGTTDLEGPPPGLHEKGSLEGTAPSEMYELLTKGK